MISHPVITIKEEPEDPGFSSAASLISGHSNPYNQSNTTSEPSTSQTNRQSPSEPSCTQTDEQSTSQTESQRPTVFKSYGVSIPKFGDNGRVLTLGQRLALIQKAQHEEQNPISSNTSTQGEPSSSTTTTNCNESRDRLDTYAGLKYNVTMKILVPDEVHRVLCQRGRESYCKEGLRTLRFTKNVYPETCECQIYIKGFPKQVLEFLYVVNDDLRKHFDGRKNMKGKAREETMLIVMAAGVCSELLRYRKGKRVIRDIEESNGVWLGLDRNLVEGECTITITGHDQQIRNALRQFVGEVVTSESAESLPSFFYYIPSPGYRNYISRRGETYCNNTYSSNYSTYNYSDTCSTYSDRTYSDSTYTNRMKVRAGSVPEGGGPAFCGPAWIACHRNQYHHWSTFNNYKF